MQNERIKMLRKLKSPRNYILWASCLKCPWHRISTTERQPKHHCVTSVIFIQNPNRALYQLQGTKLALSQLKPGLCSSLKAVSTVFQISKAEWGSTSIQENVWNLVDSLQLIGIFFHLELSFVYRHKTIDTCKVTINRRDTVHVCVGKS